MCMDTDMYNLVYVISSLQFDSLCAEKSSELMSNIKHDLDNYCYLASDFSNRHQPHPAHLLTNVVQIKKVF